MKRLLNFGVSDPLTLAMTHPVTDRLETLSRAKTLTKGGRATVFAMISGLAVFSAPFTVAGSTQNESGHALELWFVPDREGIYTEELQRRLNAVRAGTHDQTYVTEWKGDGMGTLMENHIYVMVSGEHDDISIETTDATGKRISRTLTPEVIESIQPALMKCVDQMSVSKLPLTFETSLKTVPEYALNGPHTARCTPGTLEDRQALTIEDELNGLRQSPNIDEGRRRAKMRGVKARGLRLAFAEKYKNPTLEQKYENCLYKYGILDTEFTFLGDDPKTPQQIKASCDEIHERE